ADLRAIVGRTLAEVGAVLRGNLRELEQLAEGVERLPVLETHSDAARTRILQDLHAGLEPLLNFRGRLADQPLVDADPDAVDRLFDEVSVVRHRPGRAEAGARIVAGDEAEEKGESAHVPCDGAYAVERRRQRHGARPGYARPGPLEGGDVASRSREPQRARRVG